MIVKTARIDWIPADQGGRTRPPSGTAPHPYTTVVEFDEPWPDPDDAWSLVVEKIEAFSTELSWVADVRFLVSKAPQQYLTDGSTFRLYEGRKCVARGRILDHRT